MSGDAVLLRRCGIVWAIPADAVGAVRTAGRTARVEAAGRTLVADEMPQLVRSLQLRPPGAVLRRFWPFPCAGLTAVDGTPVVAVAADDPPPYLLDKEGEAPDDL